MIQFSLIGFELAVVGLMLAVLLGDAFARAATRRHWGVAVAAVLLALAGYAAAGGGLLSGAGARVATAGGLFVVDAFALWVKAFALVATAVCVLITVRGAGEEAPGFAEQTVLQLGACLGMMALGSARDLITLYVSIELMAIGLFVLVAWRKEDPLCLEAGVKYMIYGAMASAIMLYGLVLVYGASGSLEFGAIRHFAEAHPDSVVLLAGVALIFVGIGFKISAAPFHWWTPDVYEGAPLPALTLLALLSKPAGFIVLARLFLDVFWPLREMWQGPLAVAGAGTLLWGGLGGLSQTNLKRLLAYSGISHSGFMLLALATAGASGAVALLYYLVAYLLGAGLIFAAMPGAADPRGRYDLREIAGLARRSPWTAGAMLLGLFGLGGIPPLAGFLGKLLVIRCVVAESGWWLAGAAVAGAVCSLAYYLRVVKAILGAAKENAPPRPAEGRLARALTAALGLGGILAGAWPAGIWASLRDAADALFR